MYFLFFNFYKMYIIDYMMWMVFLYICNQMILLDKLRRFKQINGLTLALEQLV